MNNTRLIEIKSVEEFDNTLKSKELVVVQFSATWCGPCRIIKPTIEKISEECTNIEFLYVDVDKFGEIAGNYGVQGVPAFFFIKNCETISSVIGADERAIRVEVEKLNSDN